MLLNIKKRISILSLDVYHRFLIIIFAWSCLISISILTLLTAFSIYHFPSDKEYIF